MMQQHTLYHFCCGLGGGAKGLNRAKPIVGNLQAKWECLGGIDVDPRGLVDFSRLAGVPGTLLDLFTRDRDEWGIRLDPIGEHAEGILSARAKGPRHSPAAAI